jgi:hypothetical protein
LILIAELKRPEQHRLDETEDESVCADTNREQRHDQKGEQWAPNVRAQGKSKIVQHGAVVSPAGRLHA